MTQATPVTTPAATRDRFNRSLRDLRISVTDRCNFRCGYCMPRSHFGPGYRFLGRDELLTPEEIARLAGIFTSLGVSAIRLTGGEPLLRPELQEIVERLAALTVSDLALTTNGALLRRQAVRLRASGLKRVTVSLDSLDGEVFSAMSDAGIGLATVLDGITAATEAGLQPVKLNCVVRRGLNDSGIVELADFARAQRLSLRFIELMDVGTTNHWQRPQVVAGEEILAMIGAVHPLDPIAGGEGDVAKRYRYRDGAGEVGVITSVTQPFCGDCTRARLGADGRLFTCLFATTGLDLRAPLRQGADDATLRAMIGERWRQRDDRYSELRATEGGGGRRIEMSYIGG